MIFKNLKVVELASVLAGPSAGTFFLELGATVIKVEQPNKGDLSRKWKTQLEPTNNNFSTYYFSVNSTKQVIELDFKENYQEILELIKNCDILLTNFTHHQAEKFKLSKAIIQQINPKCIQGNITGYGESSNRKAFDVVLQAESGFVSITGSNQNLAKLPVALIDLVAGHQLKEAILIALINKLQTNKGAYVSVSLERAAYSMLINQASNVLTFNYKAEATGMLHPNIAPYGEIINVSGGPQYVLAIGTNEQFISLINALNITNKIPEEWRNSNVQRLKNRLELHQILKTKCISLSEQELDLIIQQKNLPIGKINSLKTALSTESAQNITETATINNVEYQRIQTNIFNIELFK
jgi:crotonobetainyl-CoA:carnitine CoA-transferase CaiB-like acyl-CoA transferase